MPLRPTWRDFEIDGRPLFEECQGYLKAAQKLIDDARQIVTQVHGTQCLTVPI
jgi:hypothetical protein